MVRTQKQKEDGQAIIYIAAAVPGLLISLGFAYLRMRKRAKLEGRRFFRPWCGTGSRSQRPGSWPTYTSPASP